MEYQKELDYFPYECDLCGKSFKTRQQAKMHSTTHMQNIPISMNKESTPPQTPPKESTFREMQITQPKLRGSIEEKRAELELMRLDREIEKLSKPDIPETNYFKEMLQQQGEHFKQLLLMHQQQGDLKIEIEKLKLAGEMGGGEDETFKYLEILKPILPMLAAKFTGQQAPAAAPTQPAEMPEFIESDLERVYIEQIKSGLISVEDAYTDFITKMPDYKAVVSFEMFAETFNKIKTEETPKKSKKKPKKEDI